MKLKRIFLSVICSLILLNTSAPVFAAEVNYQTYFNVDEVNFIENKESNVILVKNINKITIFSAETVDETVYTTTYVNLRSVPTVNSDRVDCIPTETEVHRIGTSATGWDIVEINEQYYFMWSEYLTTEKPEVEETYSSSLSDAEYEAKEWIAMKESGGSYTAVNSSSGCYGRYQLLPSYLNGDYSIENQERTADAYVAERYGSWVAAKSFWESHGWY